MNKVIRARKFWLISLLVFASSLAISQTQFGPGPQTANFTANMVRGYHFTSPVAFNICQLYVPNDMNSNNWHVEVVKFNTAAPPAFPGTTNAFTSLFYANNITGTTPITCNIPIAAGDIIGIYGSRSGTTPQQMANSYDGTNFVTTILGNAVTLSRSGMQFTLQNQQMHDIWSEVNFNTSRIYGFYGCCPTPPPPGQITMSNNACITPGDTLTFSVPNDTLAVTYNWDVPSTDMIVVNNDSMIQLVVGPNSTGGQICYSYTDTCTQSADTCISYMIETPTTANAGLDITECDNQSVTLDADTVAIGVGTWTILSAPPNGIGTLSNVNDPKGSYSGGAPGLHLLEWSVANANCPVSRDTVELNLLASPSADFTLQNVCDGSPVSFINSSQSNGTVITGYHWDFDGDSIFTSTLVNDTFTYPTFGVYDVNLVAASGFCNDTVTKQVVIEPIPDVDFTITPACEGSPAGFVDVSVLVFGTISSSIWSFGDGASDSTMLYANHVYDTAGYYPVSLSLTSAAGCSSSHTDTIEIYSVPKPIFGWEDTCADVAFSFTDSSTSVIGTVNYWSWNFGDGSPSVQSQNATHEFFTHNTYQVNLTVATNKGCTATVPQTVRAYPVPVPDFSTIDECEKQPMFFKDDSYVDNMFGSYVSDWKWYYGDGDSAMVRNSNHFYQSPGYFNATLIATSNYGCDTSITKQVLLRPQPKADFILTGNNQCAGEKVEVIDQTKFDYQFDNQGVTDYTWYFGDGVMKKVPSTSHNYAEGGEYEILYIVETDYGCIDSVTKTVSAYHIPEADYTIANIESCSPHCAQFINNSKLAGSDALFHRWSFGDGRFSSESEPSICFEIEDGEISQEYVTSLRVYTEHGCEDSFTYSKPLEVHPNPIASFELEKNVVNQLDPVIYIDNTTIGGHRFKWTFGDASVSEVRNPYAHTYATPGEYTVMLETESDKGCKDVYSRIVKVKGHEAFFIPNAFTPNGDGLNETFEVKGEGLEYSRLWIFDRLGNELYYGENDNISWDGTHDGKLMPLGTYAYVFEYKYEGRDPEKTSGTLNISETKEN